MFPKKSKLFWPILSILFSIGIKMVFMLTHYIQEDAFITWRVARNLMDYGVLGFNGEEKISASTTHFYVFVSYFFQLVFGKDSFIEPILIFNSLLFSLGSYLLSKFLLENPIHQAIFIFLLGVLPPSIKISILGMEYGILFFLEMAFIYFGFFEKKKWALLLLPFVILFTRIDSLIFLGIIFLVDAFWNKKTNWIYIIGGIIGVLGVLAFNWFYFGEIINNTIVAKKIAYQKPFTLEQDLHYFIVNFGNFWGMMKLPFQINLFTILVLIFEWVCFILLIRIKKDRNFFLWMIFIFGWCKQIIFLSQKSLFDWYYWVPQLLLFVPILVLVIEQKSKKYLWLFLLILFYIVPMFAYQTIHAIATGNGEWNYRRTIGLYLNDFEKDKKQSIFLEPAGYIPYFSGLITLDEVGLVNKKVLDEIKKDPINFKINVVKKYHPKYILSYENLNQNPNAKFYENNYKLIKTFRVKDYLYHPNPWIEKIYRLKPSGTDYNLYQRIP